MAERAERRVAVEVASGFGPATVAAKLLSDVGYRVLKVEPPDGDEMRARTAAPGRFDLWDLLCGSKDSVVIDPERPGGKDALAALLDAADVAIVDRDAFLRLGGPADARRRGLTLCVASSFGIDGPMADWRGGEEIVQALSGIVSVTGHIGATPVRIAGAMLTHATANLAAAAILSDEIAKRRGAPGALLDACLFDTALAFQTSAVPAYFLDGASPGGIGNRHTMAAPWNSFACRDGWIVVCAGNAPTWTRLCAAIGRNDLAADPAFATQQDRVRNVDALEGEVEAWTRVRSIVEVELALDSAGIPCGRILPLETVLDHPQFRARGLARAVGGRTIAGGLFFRDGRELPVRAGACGLGEGTDAVFRDIVRVPPASYARWIGEGAVRTWEAGHVVAV